METSRIHELLPAFNERNNVLYLVLGLQATTQDWLRLVHAQAAGGTGSITAAGDESNEELSSDFLYFLLGAISFSNHLQAVLERARTSLPDQEAEADDSPAWLDLRGLLR